MRIANLRTGDLFIFDHELFECRAAGNAVVTESGDVVVTYEDGREVRSRTFGSSVEVDLIDRIKTLPESSGCNQQLKLKANQHGHRSNIRTQVHQRD